MIEGLEYYCYPCLVRQALDMLIELSSLDNEKKREIIKKAIGYISQFSHRTPPVIAGKKLSEYISELTGVKDPFYQRKLLFNKKGLEILPKVKEIVKKGEDPLELSIRFSIIANLIDFGALSPQSDDIKKIFELYRVPFSINDYDKLMEELKRCSSIVILGDNAGEIVFDKLFIEELPRDIKVTYIVRGAPILNDATLEDAYYIGLDKLCEVKTTGENLPGVFWDRLPQEIKNLILNSDLVISKGQGNFESFEPPANIKVCYLLVAKCRLISSILNVKPGSMIIKCRF